MSLRITVFLFLKIFPEKLDARRKEKLKREGEGGEDKLISLHLPLLLPLLLLETRFLAKYFLCKSSWQETIVTTLKRKRLRVRGEFRRNLAGEAAETGLRKFARTRLRQTYFHHALTIPLPTSPRIGNSQRRDVSRRGYNATLH